MSATSPATTIEALSESRAAIRLIACALLGVLATSAFVDWPLEVQIFVAYFGGLAFVGWLILMALVRIAQKLFGRVPDRPKGFRTLYLAPGWKLLKLIERAYSKRTVTEVFLPTVRDMQHEHIEALSVGDKWNARLALVRGYWSIGAAAFAQLPVSLIKLVVTLWRAAS